MLKKIFIVVDCADEAEKERVQAIANEVSNMRVLNGAKIERVFPFVKKNKRELLEIFNVMSKGGVKGFVSAAAIAAKMVRK